MKALTFVMTFMVLGSAMAKERVVKLETLGAETVLEETSTANFCIKNVATSAIYETIYNDRGLRQYECQVKFEGQDRQTKRKITGSRIISYHTAPVVLERKKLKRQTDYLEQYEDEDHMIGYVAVPKHIYKLLPNVSKEREAKKINEMAYALIPSDASFNAAVRTACYVALLETLDNTCSEGDAAKIMNEVEIKINDLNPNGEQTQYADNE